MFNQKHTLSISERDHNESLAWHKTITVRISGSSPDFLSINTPVSQHSDHIYMRDTAWGMLEGCSAIYVNR